MRIDLAALLAKTLQFVNKGASADPKRGCSLSAIEFVLAQGFEHRLPLDQIGRAHV
jgi:hypothetical protein